MQNLLLKNGVSSQELLKKIFIKFVKKFRNKKFGTKTRIPGKLKIL